MTNHAIPAAPSPHEGPIVDAWTSAMANLAAAGIAFQVVDDRATLDANAPGGSEAPRPVREAA